MFGHELPVINVHKSADFAGASKDDVLLVGTCDSSIGALPIHKFKGKVVFLDGESRQCNVGEMKPPEHTFLVSPRPRPQVVIPAHFLPLPYGVYQMLSLGIHFTEEPRLVHRSEMKKMKKKKFMVYANRHCTKERERFFSRVVGDARLPAPHAGGKCVGGHPERKVQLPGGGRSTWQNNQKDFSGYRYVLCAENGDVPMYFTEKLPNTFAAGAIPVYWGSKDIFHFFNRDAFVFFDPDRPKRALDQLAELERNESAFMSMLSQPVLAPGAQNLLFPRVGGMIRDFLGITAVKGDLALADAPSWLYGTGPSR